MNELVLIGISIFEEEQLTLIWSLLWVSENDTAGLSVAGGNLRQQRIE